MNSLSQYTLFKNSDKHFTYGRQTLLPDQIAKFFFIIQNVSNMQLAASSLTVTIDLSFSHSHIQILLLALAIKISIWYTTMHPHLASNYSSKLPIYIQDIFLCANLDLLNNYCTTIICTFYYGLVYSNIYHFITTTILLLGRF